MKSRLLAWVVILACSLPLLGAKPPTQRLSSKEKKKLFVEANALYNKGKYQKATKLFQKCLAGGKWVSFPVFYNLGNAYFRLQEYGKALVYYRKAERLQPNNEKLLHNIQLLFQQVGRVSSNKTKAKNKIFFWYYLFNLRTLFWSFFLVFVVSFVLLAGWMRVKLQKPDSMVRWLVFASFFVSVLFGGSFVIKYTQQMYKKVGVVVANKITARSGFAKSYEPLFLLKEADEVQVFEKVQGWYKIRFQSPKDKQKTTTGWIPETALLLQ